MSEKMLWGKHESGGVAARESSKELWK
jgi:hypothetical protein